MVPLSFVSYRTNPLSCCRFSNVVGNVPLNEVFAPSKAVISVRLPYSIGIVPLI